MNYTNQLLVITTLFSFLCNSIFAQSKEIKEIDSLMKHSNSTGVFNGNVLVSKNDKIIYASSFGFSDASKKDRLTKDSRFHLGSITKEFSAAALLQLEEKGKLKLSDPVSKFIPELPAWANEVTIKDLLQYTSGIPNVNWKKIKNDKDLFDGLMSVEKLDFKPGTDYDYNNNNIFLRHFIIERLTGISFKKHAEQFIFKPLDMNSSVMTPLENEKNITKGFKNNLVQDAAEIPITGGTYTTTYDLLKWTNSLHSKKVVNRNSLYELGKSFDTAKSQSALGKAKFKNKKLIEHIHDGRAGSFEAILFSDVEKKITIILLSNNYNGKVYEISEKINVILQNQKE
jgi:CubicO group peptidase (beta-lactamase class C family)